ncbi:sarcosine oxidase subunit gamma [Pacificoceanicola onchidii]|uniref:sarcosine oxidase subunit gamma n=1 Tax=Pacificoceanicola onchidii TaxID=2562685 RepID=UPI0010A6897A|nr:sarcosine oxidase subunit gamma [Pacificoceanicola onchidii]
MTDLIAKTPCAGLLPVSHGGWSLSEVDCGPITWLAPFHGQAEALDAALQTAHGLGLPRPGNSTRAGAARCLWFGKEQVMLTGVEPGDALAQCAAMSDQSDGWAVVRLEGADGADVLARLVPIDLRPSAFPDGAVARTLCQHMTVTILRENVDALVIFAFRSMAKTLVHDVETAMVSVAAQHAAP